MNRKRQFWWEYQRVTALDILLQWFDLRGTTFKVIIILIACSNIFDVCSENIRSIGSIGNSDAILVTVQHLAGVFGLLRVWQYYCWSMTMEILKCPCQVRFGLTSFKNMHTHHQSQPLRKPPLQCWQQRDNATWLCQWRKTDTRRRRRNRLRSVTRAPTRWRRWFIHKNESESVCHTDASMRVCSYVCYSGDRVRMQCVDVRMCALVFARRCAWMSVMSSFGANERENTCNKKYENRWIMCLLRFGSRTVLFCAFVCVYVCLCMHTTCASSFCSKPSDPETEPRRTF